MNAVFEKKERNSNLELFRIIVMFLIVLHHYVVNSGLNNYLNTDLSNVNNVLAQFFGSWGKVGINCFVLITGYFMCISNITLFKFVKLIGEIYFYKFLIFGIFLVFGHESISLYSVMKLILPFTSVSTNFVGCFILFWLFIPFLNKLIGVLDRKMHLRLIFLCLFIYSLFDFVPNFYVYSNYVTWFIVLYFIASYLRFYPIKRDKDKNFWKMATIVSVAVSLLMSVAYMIVVGRGGRLWSFLVDSNAPMALLVALCAFMYFKNIQIKQSKGINIVGGSTFGVLLIHANSDAMRQWLWVDTLKNVDWFFSSYFVLHMLISCFLVFVICIIIDRLRILFIERPFMKKCDRLLNRLSLKMKQSRY